MTTAGLDSSRRASRRSRMADVAQLAGVSTSTVSRALSRPDAVSAELRGRVEDAIRRLGYVPNLMAGALAAARSRTVGVIVPSIINSFFAATVEEMAAALAARGYQLMLGNSGYAPETEEALVESFLAWSPAAIVLTGLHHSRRTTRLLLDQEIPIVEMWEMGERPLDALVGFSHRALGRAVGRHLYAAGRRRVAFVGAAMDRDLRAADRAAGYREAVQEAGLHAPVTLALPDRASVGAGGRGLEALLAAQPAVDAVFFSNDVLALGALFECQRQGWAVPDRIALFGFGDLDFTATSVPRLSTVRPPREEIGRRVARLLLDRFDGKGEEQAVIDLGFTLVPRDSG